MQLSPREREVLLLAAVGYEYKHIARLLKPAPGIAEKTVKNYMRSILGKLGARNARHAVFFALARGVISLDELKAIEAAKTDDLGLWV